MLFQTRPHSQLQSRADTGQGFDIGGQSDTKARDMRPKNVRDGMVD